MLLRNLGNSSKNLNEQNIVLNWAELLLEIYSRGLKPRTLTNPENVMESHQRFLFKF